MKIVVTGAAGHLGGMETESKLPLFREAFVKRRCLIPATGFFKWEKPADGRQPYRFVMRGLELFAFAGLWEFARIKGGGPAVGRGSLSDHPEAA